MPETLPGRSRAPKRFEQSRHERKKIEMRFAHLKRILKLGRLRLRGPRGAQDEFVLAAIAQNLRRLASLVARPPAVSGSVHRIASKLRQKRQGRRFRARLSTKGLTGQSNAADFCNKIGTERTCQSHCAMSFVGARAENICSRRVFPGLTQLRHWAVHCDMALMPISAPIKGPV